MAKRIIVSNKLSNAELVTAQKTCGRDYMKKTRIRAIINIVEGKTRREVAKTLCVTSDTITNWIHAYNQKGLNGLATNLGGRPGGNPIWDISMFDTLVKEINKQTQYWSIPLMQKWIENKYKKDIPESTIWYHMTSLNYSYKSARPHPKEGNVKAQLEFKKGGLLKR